MSNVFKRVRKQRKLELSIPNPSHAKDFRRVSQSFWAAQWRSRPLVSSPHPPEKHEHLSRPSVYSLAHATSNPQLKAFNHTCEQAHSPTIIKPSSIITMLFQYYSSTDSLLTAAAQNRVETNASLRPTYLCHFLPIKLYESRYVYPFIHLPTLSCPCLKMFDDFCLTDWLPFYFSLLCQCAPFPI